MKSEHTRKHFCFKLNFVGAWDFEFRKLPVQTIWMWIWYGMVCYVMFVYDSTEWWNH